MTYRWSSKLLCVLLLFAFSTVVAGEEPLFMEKLPFESATITYTLSGLQNGTETRYITESGKRSAAYIEASTSMMGMTTTVKTVEILEGEWLYTYDLVEGTGIRARNPMLYIEEEFASLSDADKELVRKNRGTIGMNMMAGMGGKVEENAEELFGFKCDRVSYSGMIVVSIHGTSIPLKTESNMMGMVVNNIATALDTGPVDDKRFAHPAGIEAIHDEEADAMSREMARQTIALLKDPQSAAKQGAMGAVDQNRMQQVPQQDQADIMKQMEEMMKNMPGASGN